MHVLADPVLLEQALQNVASNAIKYNRDGGRIVFELKVVAGRTEVSIGNTGAGIPEADQARVFERFFRGDKARTRDAAAGTGLGLSLSREIVRAHGGDLVLRSSAADWTDFVLFLPEDRRANQAL